MSYKYKNTSFNYELSISLSGIFLKSVFFTIFAQNKLCFVIQTNLITSSYVSFHQDKQFLYANKKKKTSRYSNKEAINKHIADRTNR